MRARCQDRSVDRVGLSRGTAAAFEPRPSSATTASRSWSGPTRSPGPVRAETALRPLPRADPRDPRPVPDHHPAGLDDRSVDEAAEGTVRRGAARRPDRRRPSAVSLAARVRPQLPAGHRADGRRDRHPVRGREHVPAAGARPRGVGLPAVLGRRVDGRALPRLHARPVAHRGVAVRRAGDAQRHGRPALATCTSPTAPASRRTSTWCRAAEPAVRRDPRDAWRRGASTAT